MIGYFLVILGLNRSNQVVLSKISRISGEFEIHMREFRFHLAYKAARRKTREYNKF